MNKIINANAIVAYTDHRNLNFCIRNVYQPAGLSVMQHPIKDHNPNNEAYILYLDHRKVLFRSAKVTSNRPGAFVTLWKRCKERGNIIPFDYNEAIDYVLIFVRGLSQEQGKEYKGQFFFDKSILLRKNVFSMNRKGGKLGMRVFPPWSEALAGESIQRAMNQSIRVRKTQKMSASAQKTQAWQLKYFVSFDDENAIDRVKSLWLGHTNGQGFE